jgi:hypothetical protein
MPDLFFDAVRGVHARRAKVRAMSPEPPSTQITSRPSPVRRRL